MKRLSLNNDALCQACGEPAAGLADNKGLWCEKHGRIRAVTAFETAAFDLLRTYGRREFHAAVAAIDEYGAEDPIGPNGLRSSRLAWEAAK